MKSNTLNKMVSAQVKRKKFRQSEWYGIRSLLGYNWAVFYILLGAREAGKSYSVTEYFVRKWKTKHIPFYWLRLNEASTKKLLSNNAEKLVDPDLYRRYGLELTVKGNVVYDHGEKMATVLALSTFANDKGVALFDKDFLTNNPEMMYHICLDEFQLEKTQKRQGDICYQFVNQLENLVRSTKEKMRAVIDYLPPSDAYKKRREGSVADLLMGEQSNFTNKIDFDTSLIVKNRLIKPTATIHFSKTEIYTVWDGRVIAPYNGEKCSSRIAMRPYIDLTFNQKVRDQIIEIFDNRGFYYKNLITAKKFQKAIKEIKPRKN